MKLIGKKPPLLLLVLIVVGSSSSASVYCLKRPSSSSSSRVVKVGAIFSFNSVIGRVAKPAMEIAVSDINRNPNILKGTTLKLIMEDANCSVFIASVGAFQVIETGVVALIGPQSSAMAHMIAQIANGLQVPLVSYAASDPTLSSLQFPFFFRATESDSHQMAAMADLIDFHGWKDVIVIYVDDEYGRNGISVLRDELAKKMSTISFTLPLPTQYDIHDITDLLNKSKFLGPRVYVVHIYPDSELRVFKIAWKLQMMTRNYVWLATDWLSATLDTFLPHNQTSLKILEGVVGLRQHTLQSIKKQAFMSKWRKMQRNGLLDVELNVYGLYAYDAVWAVAHAIDRFLNDNKKITFSVTNELLDMKETRIKLGQLKVFDGGNVLVKKLLDTNFTGLAGQVKFDADRGLVMSDYDVINIAKMEMHGIGYWSTYSGLSILAPEKLNVEQVSDSKLDQQLENIIWPGGSTEKPRGWEVADSERPLRIAVPNRASFVQFVTKLSSSNKIQGYCIDVFNEARKLVPYDVPYRFELFGDGLLNPNYDDLVKMVGDNVFDAAVGDIAIVTNRTIVVEFTQPYISTGLVVVAPLSNSKSSAWVFLKPFTVEMWSTIAASFLIIAIVIWILEHRVNDDFRGSPRRQILTMFMFSFSTLFKTNKEATVTTLGKMVMVIWLFLLLVITSSYTASLTSILTIQQLSSSITSINSLIAGDWPIGYQVGSFAYSYLIESLNIHQSRLISLASPQEYDRALRLGPSHGGVAAIVDELPYVELFLSNQTDFGIVGQPFTKSGWGFAFRKDSRLVVDMSTAILELAESGKLEEIHDRWFCQTGCAAEGIKNSEPKELQLSSFWALYSLSGAFFLIALIVFFLRSLLQYKRKQQMEPPPPSPSATPRSAATCSMVIHNFLDFIDDKEEAIKRVCTQHDETQTPSQLI